MTKMIVPLFCSECLAETKDFYAKHLGFRAAVELDGYAELELGEGGPRLAFMTPDGKRWQPAAGQGLIYCFQVENADAEHERLAAEGVTIVEAPSDKPWGERSFVASDPNGISLYFGHPLASGAETVETGNSVQ